MTENRASSFRLGYRPALDGFRAVAILLVILYHDRRLAGGSLGVDMFFVLSGMLITSILLEEWEATGSIRLGRFYLRRFLRLGPALIAFVCSVYVVTHFIRPSPFSGVLLDRWALAALLYVTDLVIAYGREYPLGAVSIHWSLAIEEQFYLLWPLVFRFLLRRGVSRKHIAALLLVAATVPALLRAVLLRRGSSDPTLWLRLYFAPDTRADPLLVGCALALFLAGHLDTRRAVGTGVALAGALVLGFLAATTQEVTSYAYLFAITALASAGVLFGLWNRGLGVRIFEWPPVVWVGRLSYSLYLWHSVGLEIASRETVIGKGGVLLLLAAVSYYFVERPFLELKKRLSPSGEERAGRTALKGWRFVAQTTAGLVVLAATIGVGYGRQAETARDTRVARARDGLSERPNDPERLAELAGALLQSGELDDAIAALDRAISLRPNDPRLLSTTGLALRAAGRPAEAALRLSEALRLDPQNARALFGIGELALDEDRLDDAIAAYSRSLETAPESAATHNSLGIAYSLRGEPEKAIEHFSEAVRRSPEPHILANLERARAKLKQRAKPGK